MAALRHAARRMLASQAPQPIYRAAVAEQRRRLLPTVIPSSSSAYPRRFSSMQHDEDLLTVEEKMRIYRRAAHVLYRATKAVGTIVGCCYAIKISITVLFTPIPELKSNLEESKKKAQDMLRELLDKVREA